MLVRHTVIAILKASNLTHYVEADWHEEKSKEDGGPHGARKRVVQCFPSCFQGGRRHAKAHWSHVINDGKVSLFKPLRQNCVYHWSQESFSFRYKAQHLPIRKTFV